MRAFLAVAALAGAASASPTRISDYIQAGVNPPVYNNATSPSSTSATAPAATASSATEPCLLVSKALAKQSSTGGAVDATLALRCLRSVPLDLEGDRLLLTGVQFYAQFQSTLAYLKSTPEGYLYPAVDIVGALSQLSTKLNNHGYTNEYDFQMDLLDIVNSAYDEHFNYRPDITQIFTFRRRAALYSVSQDGVSLPEVYLGDSSDEIDPTFFQSSNNSTISPVAQINGVEVEAWLNAYAATDGGGSSDPDTNYNAIFRNGLDAQSLGVFTAAAHYQGSSTNVTFRNGTTQRVENFAYTTKDFTGVVDGQTFFDVFCALATDSSDNSTDTTPSGTPSATASSTSTMAIPTTPVPFTPVPEQTSNLGPEYFPIPFVINDDNSAAGYFSEYDDDLAVLALTTFLPADDTQFSNVVREFLANSQQASKTKLVIDLRGNGGGDVPLAYDTFAQLFPSIVPYGATNFRATQFWNDLGKIVGGFYANVSDETATTDDCGNNYSTPPLNFGDELTTNNTHFNTWEQFFGPYEHHGDNFTALSRYDLDSPFVFSCEPVSNFGSLADITPVQVFDAQNILLIQDGTCASTCAVFSEFMKSQAGVQTVVFGGRKQTGPMQGVGGVKGANDYPINVMSSAFEIAVTENSTPAQAQYLNNTYGNLTIPTQYVLGRINDPNDDARVNIRNNIRVGDESYTPLQFVYEAADCRLFYTADMITQQDLVWQAAADVYWGNASCVPGSTDQPSSGLSVNNIPPASAKNFFGANRTSVFPLDLTKYTNASTPTTGNRAAATSVTAFTGAAGSVQVGGASLALACVMAGFAVFL